jgi:hypothetical protein
MLKDASDVKRSLLCKRMSLKWKEYHFCLKMITYTSNVNSSARISGHGHDVGVIGRDDDQRFFEVDQLQGSLDGSIKGHSLVHGFDGLF